MKFGAQSNRYSWTITNTFLVIIFIARRCVGPFFPLYLKYLRLSVLEMGVIRGIQAWSAVTIPLFVFLAKQTYDVRQKRALIAVSVFTAIGTCICLVYVPPHEVPLNVTHCKSDVGNKIEKIISHGSNSDGWKSVAYNVSHNSLVNQLIQITDRPTIEIQNMVPSVTNAATKSNIIHKTNSTASNVQVLNTFNTNRYINGGNESMDVHNMEIPTSHVTNLPILYKSTSTKKTTNVGVEPNYQASQNQNKNSALHIYTKSILNETKLVENVTEIVSSDVLINEPSTTMQFDMSHLLPEMLNTKFKNGKDNYLSVAVTDFPEEVIVNTDFNILKSNNKLLIPGSLAFKKEVTSKPFYNFPEDKLTAHGKIDIKQNSGKQIFNSFDVQDKIKIMQLLQHLQNVQTINNKAVGDKSKRLLPQKVQPNKNKAVKPKSTFNSYKLPLSITNVNNSVKFFNNIKGSKHLNFNNPSSSNSGKQHNENETYIPFNKKISDIKQQEDGRKSHDQDKKVLNNNVWDKLSKLFFQNKNKDFKNILQHAKTSVNINTSLLSKKNTMTNHNRHENFQNRLNSKIRNTRRLFPQSRPTRASDSNVIKIERHLSKSLCNTSLNKSACVMKHSKHHHDSSLVEIPNNTDIWRFMITKHKIRMQHGQKYNLGNKSDTFNSLTSNIMNHQVMKLNINKDKEFDTSNSQPLSKKRIKSKHSYDRHNMNSLLVNRHNSPRRSVYHVMNKSKTRPKSPAALLISNKNINKMQVLSSMDDDEVLTNTIVESKHNHNMPSSSNLYNKNSHTFRTLKSVQTEKYLPTIKEIKNNTNDTTGYIHSFPLFDKQLDFLSWSMNGTWSHIFVTVLLLATLYEVCSCMISPCVEVFWRQKFDDEETSDFQKTSESLNLWSLRLWGLVGCPALAILSVMSHCPYQLTFHLVLSTVILFAALLLVLFILPLTAESSNYQFRKRKPSKPHYMTFNLEQEKNIFYRICCALTTIVTGFNMSCYVEFILWHIQSLQGFPYNYEFLYCTYFAISTLVQVPITRLLYQVRWEKYSLDKEMIEDAEAEKYGTNLPHYDWCERTKLDDRCGPSVATITGHALLALQLVLLPLLQSPYVLLLLSPLKGCSDALLESCPWSGVSLAWALGYGSGCLLGGLTASAWGINYLFWAAAIVAFVWSLACALCYGFVNFLGSKFNHPYNRLLLIQEHPVKEYESESNDWLELALQKEEFEQSKALLK